MQIKKISAAAVAAVLGLSLTACGGGTNPEPTNTQQPIASATSQVPSPTTPAAAPTSTPSKPAAEATLTKGADGKLTDTDMKANVIEGAGIRIEIDPAAKHARAQTVDPATGGDFADWFEWDFNSGIFTRHHLGARSGTMTRYQADIKTGELQEIISADGQPMNDRIKQMGGAWDTSVNDTKQAHNGTEEWFKKRYGMTIEQAATGA